VTWLDAEAVQFAQSLGCMFRVLPVADGWRHCQARHMTAANEPRRLELEVRFDAEPIEGRLYDKDGNRRLERPFSGWLGLMAAIEAARGDPRPEGDNGGTR
jgi:hypothetical protein